MLQTDEKGDVKSLSKSIVEASNLGKKKLDIV